jgi:hypothetical protein
MSEHHGSMRMADGSRVQLTPEQAKALWDAAEKAQADRAKDLPDTNACLSNLCSAKGRLQELGWREITYCPRDGSRFAVCEIGSTGMWTAYFADPWVMYADCVGHPKNRSMFFKPMDKLTNEERALLAKCDQSVADEIDRMGAMFR